MAAEAQRHNGSTLGERMSMQSHGLNNKANIYMSAWANASMRNFDTCKQLHFVLSCKRCDVHTTQKSELPNSCVHVSETRSSNGLFQIYFCIRIRVICKRSDDVCERSFQLPFRGASVLSRRLRRHVDELQ